MNKAVFLQTRIVYELIADEVSMASSWLGIMAAHAYTVPFVLLPKGTKFEPSVDQNMNNIVKHQFKALYS